MNTKFLYETVTSAINELRKMGFNKNFSLVHNYIMWGKTRFEINDLKIVSLFRYDGDSDPADKASVYGLVSGQGLKGILVTNDGADAETPSSLLRKLHLRFLHSGSKKNLKQESTIYDR